MGRNGTWSTVGQLSEAPPMRPGRFAGIGTLPTRSAGEVYIQARNTLRWPAADEGVSRTRRPRENVMKSMTLPLPAQSSIPHPIRRDAGRTARLPIVPHLCNTCQHLLHTLQCHGVSPLARRLGNFAPAR